MFNHENNQNILSFVIPPFLHSSMKHKHCNIFMRILLDYRMKIAESFYMYVYDKIYPPKKARLYEFRMNIMRISFKYLHVWFFVWYQYYFRTKRSTHENHANHFSPKNKEEKWCTITYTCIYLECWLFEENLLFGFKYIYIIRIRSFNITFLESNVKWC